MSCIQYYSPHELTAFEQVAKGYASTKPISGSRCQFKFDVRPIGDRKRWYERIKKISDTEYHLIDGTTCHTTLSETEEYDPAKSPAIIWERKPDGDFITIRFTPQGSHSISRPQFIRRYLPHGLHMRWDDKTDYITFKSHIDGAQQRIEVQKLLPDNSNQLVFKYIAHGVYERANKVAIKTTRLDKVKKRAMKEQLDALWDYAVTMAAILMPADYKGYGRRYGSASRDYRSIIHAECPPFEGYQHGDRAEKRRLYMLREVLDDTSHELYPAYMVTFICLSDTLLRGLTSGDADIVKKCKPIFSRLARDVFNLNSYVEM